MLVRTCCAGQNVKYVQADNHLLFAACGEAEARESDEEELSLPELVPESLLELELELGSGLRFLQQTLRTVADVQTKTDLQHVLLLYQMLSHAEPHLRLDMLRVVRWSDQKVGQSRASKRSCIQCSAT